MIIQAILPISIYDNDSLPKSICAECYNTVLNAFKLRQRSLISEKLLKEKKERQSEHSSHRQDPAPKKPRNHRNITKSSTKSNTIPQQQTMIAVQKPNQPSTSKASKSPSVDHQAVSENDVKKMQQKIEFDNQLYNELYGLRCNDMYCALREQKFFESKDLLKIHKAFEHDGVLDVESKHSVYYVQPDTNSESYMKAFGVLHFKNGILYDKENLHCKLCVLQGVMIQFPRLTESKVLLDHVVSHLKGIKFAESAKNGRLHLKRKRSQDQSKVQDENQNVASSLNVKDVSSDCETGSLVDEDVDFSYAKTTHGNLKLQIGGFSFAKLYDSVAAHCYRCIKRVS